nr:putative reverse transcriptase domain-containing protein [Tanacetum cinerariifolium]
HPGKVNVVADALSRKEREPIRVRVLVMTVHPSLHEQIRNAQSEAMEKKNVKAEKLGRLIKQIFEIHPDGTRNSWLEIGENNYGFHCWALENSEWVRLDLGYCCSIDQVSPLPTGENNGQYGEAHLVMLEEDCPSAWTRAEGIYPGTLPLVRVKVLELIQAIHTFLADKANRGIATKKNKKIKPHVIPYSWFTKLIICYLGTKHNINQRSGSLFNMAEDDHRLGNLKFVPKGEEDEHDHKIAAEEGEKKKLAAKSDQSKKPAIAKQPRLVTSKQSKPTPAKQSKPEKEKSTPVKKAAKFKVRKVRKGKSYLQLVDEPDGELQPALKPQVEDEEYDLQQVIQMILESFQAHGQAIIGGVAFREPASGMTQKLPIVKGKGKGITTYEQDDTSANIVRNTPSPIDAEIGAETNKINSEGDTEILNIGEEQGEDVATKVDLEERTVEFDKGQVGSDPGKTPEYRPPPKRVLMEEDQAGPNPGQSHVALAGPDPEPMHDNFVATMYPQVHESLKQPDEEH